MLAEVRRALADTIAAGLPGARVVPYVPNKVDIPSTGVHVFIAPRRDDWVDTWLSFSNAGRGTLHFDVIVDISAQVSPESAADLLDALADPISTSGSVFAAIMANRTLGVTAFQVDAVPLLEPLAGPVKVADADGSVVYWELTVPVSVTVQRS